MVDTVSGDSYSRGPKREAPPRAELGPSSTDPYGAHKAHLEPATPLRLDSDRDLSRVGFWSVLLGALSAVVGITFLLAGGILPGALVAGIGLICALVGALTLALVAHHQG